MQVKLKNSWLWEGDRRLKRIEVLRIARGCGYYLLENFLEWLMGKYPNAEFLIDSDYRIRGRIRAPKE